MTHRPDPSRRLLPGPIGRPAEPAAVYPARPRRGVLHFAAFVAGSVRAQKGLAFFMVVAVLFIGGALLWLDTPRWHVNTAVHSSPNLTASDQAPTQLASISANDLAHILKSPGLKSSVETELSDLIERINQRFDSASWRNRARALWSQLLRLPERLVTTAEPDAESASDEIAIDPFVIQVDPARDDRENIVGLRLSAVDPELAERAAVLLVEKARIELTLSAQERAADRLSELEPDLAEGSATLITVESAIADLQLTSGKQDPKAWARDVQEKLAMVRAERAELETDYAEAKARQFSIESKLAQEEQEHVGRVISTENPRIGELQAEIDDLEAHYASQRTRMKDKHPTMIELRQRIETKKEALSRLQRLIIQETITEPDPQYEILLNDRIQVDQLIVELSGRELGLARTEEVLADDLNEASALVNEMNGLERRRETALTRFEGLAEEAQRLQSVKDNRTLFAHVRLVDRQPVVKHPHRPDEPNVVAHLGVTSLCALFLGLLIPTLRAAGQRRLVTDWQIDELTQIAPVRVAGALPQDSPRRLLKASPRRLKP